MANSRLLEMLLPDADDFSSIFSEIALAEEEIEKAQARHEEPKPPLGERGQGPIWNSFGLLRWPHDEPAAEELYRAHCREILDRVASNRDTRPGTDAELIVVIRKATLAAPVKSGAACLYFRLFNRALPKFASSIADEIDVAAYEKVHGRIADDYEAELRVRLRQGWRNK
ncbi:hypothetical protein ACFQ61_08120 [Streptomyces sp. NPDC056500]|uniref:hypothetical protein n=1 Tax=Streptomyces sp. NPDC056500 TaxID=3345840 RepID=UPI00368D29E2